MSEKNSSFSEPVPDLTDEAQFYAILFRRDDPTISLIENKILLNTSEYTLIIGSEIPSTLLGREIRFSTGYREPLRKHMTIQTGKEPDLPSRESVQILLQKSRLVYTLSENFDSTRLYFKLVDTVDETKNYRTYDFVMYYDQIVCRTDLSEIFQLFEDAQKSTIGMLLTSSKGLGMNPEWWNRECFRDVWELELESKFPEYTLVEGPRTGILYIFDRSDVVDQEEVDMINEEFRSRMAGFRRIFPRKTPLRLIKSRCLDPLPNGQWEVKSNIPLDIDLTVDILSETYRFDNIKQLFWVLLCLMIAPTYPFLEKDLRIEVHPEEVQLTVRTEYLPDFLRVRTVSRFSGRSLIGDVNIWYTTPKDSETVLTFYDFFNNSQAWLTSDIPVPGVIVKEPVNEYTLEERIRRDIL